jgi:inner membrane protein
MVLRMNETKSIQPRTGFAGPGIKALVVSALVLVFLIPLALVGGVVEDRRETRDKAQASILDPVGGKPALFGPYLVLPYEQWKNKKLVEGELLVLPETLSLSSAVKADERRRGIFSATVIDADVTLAGTITASVSEALPFGAKARWDLARICFELPDLRALADSPRLSFDGREIVLRPDARGGRAYDKAISAKAPAAPGTRLAFTADFKLRGGDSLSFLEPGGTVLAKMYGPWPSPSFFGYSAPSERSVSEEGFSSRWYMPESARTLPRVFDADGLKRIKLAESAFGVQLLDGVDAYDMSRRATRYGILFIIVPFAALFIFELLCRVRVHPVQYVLIGLGNCVFYLLLVSLSEIVGFGAAYAIAASACAAICAAYAGAAVRSRKGLLLLPALALLYAYLYVVLSSEDYALLLGAIGLLALLVAAMAATRKVDWYGARDKTAREAPDADADFALPAMGEADKALGEINGSSGDGEA